MAQVKLNKIFDSTVPADGAWFDVSNITSLSVHIENVETKTWMEVSNDQYININGFGASGAALVAAPAAPVLNQSPAVVGGLTGQGTYFVKVTYVTPWGETTPSVESSLAVSDGNVLTVMSPIAEVTGLATGYNVYISKTTNTEVLQTTPAYVPARTVDATPGNKFAISGAIPLKQNYVAFNGITNSGIVVPSVNNGGGIGVGTNVQGTNGDFGNAATTTQTLAAIAIFVDTNQNQIMWTASGMTWKWMRIRKSTGNTRETIAWFCGVNG